MAGYATDPMSSLGLGYRSTALQGGFSLQKVSYNGFVFPPSLNAAVTLVKEYDETGRTVKYITYALTINFILTPLDESEDNTDNMVDELRARMAQPGQKLEFFGKGLGTIIVNDQSTFAFLDVDYGPRPQVVELRPIAGARAVDATVLITTRIAPCSSIQTQGRVSQLTYAVDWTTSDEGLMTRTVTAIVEVTASRTPSSTSTANNYVFISISRFAEAYAAIVGLFPPPPSFKRTLNFALSAAKKELKVTITDTEYPSDSPPSPGALEVKAVQSVSSDLERGFLDWTHSISATIKVPKTKNGINTHVNKLRAFQGFQILLQERLARADNRTYQLYGDGYSSSELREVYHVGLSVDIQDNIYENEFTFTAVYLLCCPTSLLIAATGLFDAPQLQGNTWDKWRQDLDLSNPTRLAIPASPENEAIVDLCHPIAPLSERQTIPSATATYPTTVVEPRGPTEENSWVYYDNKFFLLTKRRTLRALPLRDFSNPDLEVDISNEPPESDFNPNPDGGPPTGEEEAAIKVIQAEGPEYVVEMRGFAVRVGYRPNAPNLVQYGGQKAFKIGTDRIRQYTVAKGEQVRDKDGIVTNSAVYKITWVKRYVLAGRPKDNNFITDGKKEKH